MRRKFTEEDVSIMIDMLKEGYSYGAIGKVVGRHGQAVGRKLKKLGYAKESIDKCCLICGLKFVQSPYTSEEQKYCSSNCRSIAYFIANPERRQISYRYKQAVNNGEFNKDITIYKLIERDGERCYLCGENVLFSLDRYDLRYPTIEHVIPISRGGTHSWDNVKVACRDCNLRKSTMTDEEFLERREILNG